MAVLIALVPLLLMVLAAAWGLLVLPPQARVPVHLGFGGATRWWGRTAGLLLYPGIGVAISAFELLVASPSRARVGLVALPLGLILLLLLVFQLLAIRRARTGP
jgi:hypothetical protein